MGRLTPGWPGKGHPAPEGVDRLLEDSTWHYQVMPGCIAMVSKGRLAAHVAEMTPAAAEEMGTRFHVMAALAREAGLNTNAPCVEVLMDRVGGVTPDDLMKRRRPPHGGYPKPPKDPA